MFWSAINKPITSDWQDKPSDLYCHSPLTLILAQGLLSPNNLILLLCLAVVIISLLDQSVRLSGGIYNDTVQYYVQISFISSFPDAFLLFLLLILLILIKQNDPATENKMNDLTTNCYTISVGNVDNIW